MGSKNTIAPLITQLRERLGGLVADPLALDATPRPIIHVLRHLASQENCDGEPYDEMVAASEYIERLEAELAEQRELE